jgi:hypothetical protein
MLLLAILDLYLATSLAIFPLGAVDIFDVSNNGWARHSTNGVQLAGVLSLAGFCLLAATWRRNADLMVVPAALFGLSFLVGAINQIAPNTLPAWWMPKTPDAIHLGWLHIVLVIVAWRLLPLPRFYDIEA